MSLSQPNRLESEIFLLESSSRDSLVRIAWFVSVFQDRLLNFENIVDMDAYKSDPASVTHPEQHTQVHTDPQAGNFACFYCPLPARVNGGLEILDRVAYHRASVQGSQPVGFFRGALL